MSVVILKPIPAFTIIRPDGEAFKLPPASSLLEAMAHDHVVELCEGTATVRLHHWDGKRRGAALNSAATRLLHSPGAVQVKGQRRNAVYGDAYLMCMQVYPCIRAEMPAADLEQAMATYLPEVQICAAIAGKDVWDVYVVDPNVSQAALVVAAMALR